MIVFLKLKRLIWQLPTIIKAWSVAEEIYMIVNEVADENQAW